MTAIRALVNVDLAAEDSVLLWHTGLAAKTAKLCNACVSISEAAIQRASN